MHIPTFGQVATIGMAFFAVAAMAAPLAEPVEADLAERSTEINARGEGLVSFLPDKHKKHISNRIPQAIAGADMVARSADLEERNFKKKCKRTNHKGDCYDSDSDYEKKKKCKRNKKGKCDDSDSDNEKNKKCKRNKKGQCYNDKKNDNKYDDKKNDNKWDDKKDDKKNNNKYDDKKNDNKWDDKKNDNKYDDKKNGGNKGHY
ncbi:hypothetical protein CMUS01_08071 [Colletotrichum musicola]|uniref:Uncharacterized protein n=1 Tax=Colletotrichum musicola TaxID=2175873 RepID=A0A8H6NE86_9PEZI|nr:hypothetical protein CMUS01_08071 [Colletotrichum musicola]